MHKGRPLVCFLLRGPFTLILCYDLSSTKELIKRQFAVKKKGGPPPFQLEKHIIK